MRLPSLFLPHGGGPCFFLNPDGSCPPEWLSMRDHLASVLPSLPERPKAILIVSGHWEETEPTVHIGQQPELLYDYGGFPPHTYQLRYDAPGAPDVANAAAALLGQTRILAATEKRRGWDHGVFIPMLVIDPDCSIPVAQLSLVKGLSPVHHIAIGKALAPLREQGVLIIGSGMSFHNLRSRGTATEIATAFDNGLVAAVTEPDPERRRRRLIDWQSLPHARFAHPREEHLLPLMVALGAGEDDAAERMFYDHVLGWTISAFRFG